MSELIATAIDEVTTLPTLEEWKETLQLLQTAQSQLMMCAQTHRSTLNVLLAVVDEIGGFIELPVEAIVARPKDTYEVFGNDKTLTIKVKA